MNPDLPDFLEQAKEQVDKQLRDLSARDIAGGAPAAAIFDAVDYALGIGGKRIRPLLVYSASAAVTADHETLPEESLNAAACAIELIHTYSLIHDDLPAMDDDELRRGKPTIHIAFDEATAVLVGDALQARAFELLADAPEISAEQKVAMVKVLATASGSLGMVGGQAIDIAAVNTSLNLEELKTMHSLKTGALIRAAAALGGITTGASDKELAALDSYADQIGLAFQVVDDILDVESDTATLGKTQGKDSDANKPTYVKLMGLNGAEQEAHRLFEGALLALEPFGAPAKHLRDLARLIVDRKS